MKEVLIVDYFAGNIFNVVRAFDHLGCKTVLISNPEEARDGDYMVLPGVGAFGDGMANLNERGLVEPIFEWINKGKPFIGICLGMQLLFSSSDEFDYHEGLGVIDGPVRRLPPEPGFKVPNIGWHPLRCSSGDYQEDWKNSVLAGIPADRDMYFVHSHAPYPDDPACWLAKSQFGSHSFCAVVRKENVVGCQFHPEKSGEAGLAILSNFLNQS